MARRSSKQRTSVKRGSFLKRSRAKGKKLISLSGRGYKVKGVRTLFRKLGSAKKAANRIAYRCR